MNTYGEQARRYWQQQRPRAYSQLEDPQAFFTDFGLRLEAQIDRLQQQLLDTRPPAEAGDPLANARRIRTARTDAEEAVMRQQVYVEAEEDEDPWTAEHDELDGRIEAAEQEADDLLRRLEERD
ncbi:hypothetical protein [Nocardiopsis halophila]|uniref:hypothetical protein n=1 Tax=Nocardiopsis halophila TaxID=141692 RepID=UPI00034CB719|nr:hypothetical protein [Nocardiopsis halophila]